MVGMATRQAASASCGVLLFFTAREAGPSSTVKVPLRQRLPVITATQSGSFTGWTYGGGLEYRLGGPWSAKIEYLHFAFGTKDASLTAVTAAPIGTVYPYANALSVDTVKFGLNYQFGMGPVAPFYPSGPIFTKD